MKLVLIRHSQSLVNPNIPISTWGLSEDGVVLAKRLSMCDQIKELKVIYSSLQTKALETAILATKNTGIQIKTDTRLTESTSFTNKFVSLEELKENTKNYYASKNLSINEGETSVEALKRFNGAINEIMEVEKGSESIGIVSHGNVLASFCAQFKNQDAYTLVENMKQPDIAVLNWETKQFISFFGEIFI